MPNKYPIGITQKTVKNDQALRFWQPAHTFPQHDFFNQTDIPEYPFCAKMIGLALAIQCRTNINFGITAGNKGIDTFAAKFLKSDSAHKNFSG